MIDELARHGHEIGLATLYLIFHIFHELESAGYLRCEPEAVNGQVRKYYRITAEGREALGRLRSKIGELSREVMVEAAAPVATEKLE